MLFHQEEAVKIDATSSPAQKKAKKPRKHAEEGGLDDPGQTAVRNYLDEEDLILVKHV